jgi:predicted Zn finger-like uncharacterized protein
MGARVASRIAPTIDRLLYGGRRVKFLCERCKTRYSIGDDRVRGKILKIRCKNCANVITVREGMNEDAAGDSAARRQRPTTAAPTSLAPATGNGSSSGKAPAALEEEWYCSIDGQQSGPFSLAEAQRWVATKSYDAELHCWCEGFEDWLPVDKVSHFRNLRKPPRPNVPTASRSAVTTTRREEDPKPLFASTMAALERNADSGAARAQAVEPVPAIAPSLSTGLGARQNGTPSQTAKGTSPNSQFGGVGAPTSSATSPGMGVITTSAASNAVADMFEAKTAIDDGDSASTAISPPSDDAVPSSRGYRSGGAAIGVPEPRRVDDDDDEGELAIGEVSRVVNLADLARTRSPKKSPAARPSGRFTPLPRSPTADVRDALAQATQAAGSQGPADSAAATGALGSTASPGDSVIAAQASVKVQRRGLMVLVGLAAVFLLGGIAAVVWFVVNSGDDGSGAGSLARAGEIDTSRPEEVIRRAAQEPIAPAVGSAKPTTVVRKWTGPAVPHPGSGAISTDVPDTTDPTKTKLRIDEIEDMARKQNDGTNRCYMRAQKGALGIEIQDLKKVAVTVTVAQDGSVSEVGLSDHADDQFGKCLIGRVRTWKFRASPGGTFRFELAFAQP